MQDDLGGLDEAICGLRRQAEQLTGPVADVLNDLADELEQLGAVLPTEASA